MLTPLQLQRLVQQHSPALLLYARQWTLDAEDCVQEAFIELATAKAPDNASAWLFSTVRHKAIDRYRKAARRQRHERQRSIERQDWFEPDLDSALDGAELTQALSDLSTDQREVIIARIWGQLTIQEIADLMSCSVSTVHRRYEAGIAQLRKKVGVACPNMTNPS